jgi:hypothetical protein
MESEGSFETSVAVSPTRNLVLEYRYDDSDQVGWIRGTALDLN